MAIIDARPAHSLVNNLRGDEQGSADWFTHSGSELYARSAIPTIRRALSVADYRRGPISIVGLGACRSFYERVVARELQGSGWSPRVVASDLQESLLKNIPHELFPVHGVLSDSTRLPLPDGERRPGPKLLLLSRAIEHYLSAQGRIDLITEAARVLKPGELYLPQLSSGSPIALRAFEAGLKAIAGKEERFLTEAEYKDVLAEVARTNGGALFDQIGVGYAESQPRNTVELARRYMTPWFVSLNSGKFDRCAGVIYGVQAAMAVRERDELGKEVARGKMDRDDALALLDEVNYQRPVYHPFKNILHRAIRDSVGGRALSEADGLSIESDGNVTVTLTYPIPILRRTEHPVLAR